MSRGRQYIQFEGYFARGVLGTFNVIRGFADLRDLAAISTPYEMGETDEDGRVVGHQRQINEKHSNDIKKYLEGSDNRFIPEVILALRCELDEIEIENTVVGVENSDDDLGIGFSRRYSSKNQRIQSVWFQISELEEIRNSNLVRRLDGNHRLAQADTLVDDPAVPNKYLAPFCLVLLGSPDKDEDDFAESLIFHTINSTALPLESEHGLRLLLGQDPAHAMTADNEFAYSPELHLTRLLAENLQNLPAPARERFGEKPLTALWESARNLIAMDNTIAEDRNRLSAFAENLFAGLADVATLLTVNHPSMCRTYGFFELAARVWRGVEGEDHQSKVRSAVDHLDRIGHWLGMQGITSLLNPLSPAEQLLETFKAVQSRIPTRVFLARWYPTQDALGDAFNKANYRLQQLRQTLEKIAQDHGVELELIDMGTQGGGTFPIHSRMYEAIASSDIVICDLTGQRPNVFVEAGFALNHHEKNRLIFLFEPSDAEDEVPFDLDTFKYLPITQAAEIPDKLLPEIQAILRSAGSNI
jgi:hypothetical protein